MSACFFILKTLTNSKYFVSAIGQFPPVYVSKPPSRTIFRITGGFLYAVSGSNHHCRISEEGYSKNFLKLVSDFMEGGKNFDFDFSIKKSSKNLKTISAYTCTKVIVLIY